MYLSKLTKCDLINIKKLFDCSLYTRTFINSQNGSEPCVILLKKSKSLQPFLILTDFDCYDSCSTLSQKDLNAIKNTYRQYMSTKWGENYKLSLDYYLDEKQSQFSHEIPQI